MVFRTIRGLEPVRSHMRWLHDLRNAVSTASVAASVGQRMLRDDAASAAAMLEEAERALAQCRELLACAKEHLREDEAAVAAPAATVERSRRRDDAHVTH